MTGGPGKVAFLGLGLMGSRQASRLLAAGFELTLWNRTAERAAPLSRLGARIAESPAGAVNDADIVVVMLENGPVVDAVLFGGGVAEAMPRGSLLVDMSSIKPDEARAHAAFLAARGVAHLDAPVSGGTVGAENGTLAIMVGGEPGDFARAESLLSIMGRAVHVGPHGCGQLAKLANQIIVGVTIGGVAEALVLAMAGGADPRRVCDAMRGGFADSRVLELHAPRMIAGDYTTKGRTVTHLKDIENALSAAASAGLSLPLTAVVTDLMKGLVAAHGDLDHSALLLELQRRNPTLTGP